MPEDSTCEELLARLRKLYDWIDLYKELTPGLRAESKKIMIDAMQTVQDHIVELNKQLEKCK